MFSISSIVQRKPSGSKRPLSFWLLAAFFALFVLFLYGPMFAIFVLSFQGPEGGLTFPLRGLSLHWFGVLWEGIGTVDIGAAFRRSLALGSVVMALTVPSAELNSLGSASTRKTCSSESMRLMSLRNADAPNNPCK